MDRLPRTTWCGLVQCFRQLVTRKDRSSSSFDWRDFGPGELATLELDLALNSCHNATALHETRQHAAALAGALCIRFGPVLRPDIRRSLITIAAERVFIVGCGAILATTHAWAEANTGAADPPLPPGGVVFPIERIVFIDAGIGQWDNLADSAKATLMRHMGQPAGSRLDRKQPDSTAAQTYRDAQRLRIISEEIVHLAQDPRLSIEVRELLVARYKQAILADLLPALHPAFYTNERDQRLVDSCKPLVQQYGADSIDRYNFGTLHDRTSHSSITQTIEQQAAAVLSADQPSHLPAECP